MKLVAAICLTLLASPALAQDGTLRLAWSSCPGNADAASGVVFDCDPQSGSVYRLFTTFTLSNTVSDVVRMDGMVDFAMRDAPAVPPFWHFESGSCNASGLQLADGLPATGCSGARNTLCGAGGTSCAGAVTAYAVGPPGGLPANRAALFVTIPRSPSSPVTISAGGPGNFGMELRFLMDNAGAACSGCTQVVAITWSQAELFGAAGQSLARLDSTTPGSDATAYANCSGCGIVQRRDPSWGLLKALYR